jgi:hypothetical protein
LNVASLDCLLIKLERNAGAAPFCLIEVSRSIGPRAHIKDTSVLAAIEKARGRRIDSCLIHIIGFELRSRL